MFDLAAYRSVRRQANEGLEAERGEREQSGSNNKLLHRTIEHPKLGIRRDPQWSSSPAPNFSSAELYVWFIHSEAVTLVEGISCLPVSNYFTDFYRHDNRMVYNVTVKRRWCRGYVNMGIYWDWKCLGGNGIKGWVKLLPVQIQVRYHFGKEWTETGFEGEDRGLCLWRGVPWWDGTGWMEMRGADRQWWGRSRAQPQYKWV